MHSRVFQLEKGIRKSEYEDNDISLLTEDEVEKCNFPDPNWVDWWKDSESTPEEDFDWLVENLPKGCFEVDKENLSLTLVKLPTDYVSEYFDKIKEEASNLSLATYLDNKCSTWNLEKLMLNGNHDFMVYQDEDHYPIYLHNWLMGLAKYGQVGETYYLGGILDYHF